VALFDVGGLGASLYQLHQGGFGLSDLPKVIDCERRIDPLPQIGSIQLDPATQSFGVARRSRWEGALPRLECCPKLTYYLI